MFYHLLGSRDFMFHWGGAAFFQTGSFFSLVAFPWLMLSVTDNDPLAATMVMAAISMPHGIFVLFGGVLADRMPPAKLLYFSRFSFFMVMLSFAWLVHLQKVSLPMIYFYAFFTGVLGAIGFPAIQSLLPAIVEKKALGVANAIVMGTNQFAQIAGPVLAGWLIWFGRSIFSVPEGDIPFSALALAFFLDALAALIAFFMATNVRSSPFPKSSSKQKVIAFMSQGFLFCWHDKGIRIVIFYMLAISFFLNGPLFASLPLFTKVTLGLTEAMYGNLYAVLGIGTILGAIIAATKVSVTRNLGTVVLCCNLVSALAFLLMGFAQNLWWAVISLTLVGICGGVVMIAGTTWFQLRTPPALMGRVMGVLMFSVIGLIPISATLSGYVISIGSIGSVFLGCGLAVSLFAGVGLLLPSIRGMGDLPAQSKSSAATVDC